MVRQEISREFENYTIFAYLHMKAHYCRTNLWLWIFYFSSKYWIAYWYGVCQETLSFVIKSINMGNSCKVTIEKIVTSSNVSSFLLLKEFASLLHCFSISLSFLMQNQRGIGLKGLPTLIQKLKLTRKQGSCHYSNSTTFYRNLDFPSYT